MGFKVTIDYSLQRFRHAARIPVPTTRWWTDYCIITIIESCLIQTRI